MRKFRSSQGGRDRFDEVATDFSNLDGRPAVFALCRVAACCLASARRAWLASMVGMTSTWASTHR